MYEHFYNLKEPPFSLTPDPKFLYLSQGHREAYSQLLLGLRLKRGFVVLTGEVGTGKTTILRTVMEEIEQGASKAFIFHTLLSAKGLLQNICNEFQIDTAGLQSKTEYVIKLQEFLTRLTAEGRTAILMIDEAHNLKEEVLEEIRLLSNIETNAEKALQIFLVGQPELKEKLKNPSLRQLDQRISMRFHLTKLSQEETGKYIQHRLSVAGSRFLGELFTADAIRKIHKISEGIPRKINTICENALIMGYVKGAKQIGSEIITAIGFGDSYQEISMDEFTTADSALAKATTREQIKSKLQDEHSTDWFNFKEFGSREPEKAEKETLKEEQPMVNTIVEKENKDTNKEAVSLPSLGGKQATFKSITIDSPSEKDTAPTTQSHLNNETKRTSPLLPKSSMIYFNRMDHKKLLLQQNKRFLLQALNLLMGNHQQGQTIEAIWNSSKSSNKFQRRCFIDWTNTF